MQEACFALLRVLVLQILQLVCFAVPRIHFCTD